MLVVNGKRPKVCIDPGHGGKDPGAIGQEGLRESDINLAIGKEVIIELDSIGIEGYLTREDDSFLELYQRTNLSQGANCFVSVHCNAFKATNVEGIETIYGPSGRSKALGHYLQKSMMKHLKDHLDRRPKKTGSREYPRRLYVLLNTPCPAALVEAEFISNPKQAAFLKNESHQRQMAHAMALGIRSFLRSLPNSEEIEEDFYNEPQIGSASVDPLEELKGGAE